MKENIIKLVNILDRYYEIPAKTKGMNVIRNIGQILAVVSSYWPMADNYTIEDLHAALDEFDAPFIINWLGVKEYLLIEK